MQVNIDSSVLRSIQPQPPSSSSSTPLVGAIDQGTSSTRFLVFTPLGRVAASAQIELRQIYDPKHEGWHEHCPDEMWESTLACMTAVGDALRKEGISGGGGGLPRLAAIGITNQRETTLAWNKSTGRPYHNAIVWDDTRTHDIVRSVLSSSSDDSASLFRTKTGLPVATYFAGSKVKWLLDHVPSLRDDLRDPDERRQICFGTVDSWLLWKLTAGKTFATDVTNASRWLFMDLTTCAFDKDLVDRMCRPHDVPLDCLPEIRPSSGSFGAIDPSCGLEPSHRDLFSDVPLSGVLGDQQAALFGQTAFRPGRAKNTYGTGLFLMMNTGTRPVPSTHGLLTTVAYRLGRDGDVVYALEGSVSHSGSTIRWLRDRLRLIDSASDSETYARETERNQGLYLVPAFSGLFSPRWNDRARACIVGMTAAHHRGHVCRAALEAPCYQTRELFEAISKDSGVELTSLNVDGGGTVNRFMMQFQADILGVEVVTPVVRETTSLGAAFAAGLAVGVWRDLEEIEGLWAEEERFAPGMEERERERNWRGWNRAVERSLDWVEEDDDI